MSSPLLGERRLALALRLRLARARGDASTMRGGVGEVDCLLRQDVGHPLYSTMLALEQALCLRTLGDEAGAASVAGAARRRVLRIAATLSEHPQAMAAFLSRIPENAMTLALAEDLCGRAG